MSFSETLKKILDKNKIKFNESNYKLTAEFYDGENLEIDLSYLKSAKKNKLNNNSQSKIEHFR